MGGSGEPYVLPTSLVSHRQVQCRLPAIVSMLPTLAQRGPKNAKGDVSLDHLFGVKTLSQSKNIKEQKNKQTQRVLLLNILLHGSCVTTMKIKKQVWQ